MRDGADEKESLIESNSHLRSEVKALTQQISSLEKQLEDSMYETYLHEEQCRNLKDELAEARSKMKRMVSNEPEKEEDYTMRSTRIGGNRARIDSLMRSSNVLNIFNGTASISRRTAGDNDEVFVLKHTFEKKDTIEWPEE